MKRLAFALTLLFVLAIGTSALAQEAGAPPPPPFGQGHCDKLELAKLWKLTEVLQLDEQRAAKLFPVISKYDRMIREKVIEKMETGKKLKAHLDGVAKLSQNEMLQISRKLWTVDQDIARLQVERFDAVSKLLSPEEAAKYSVFEVVFQEEIRKAMRRMKGPNMPPHGQPPAPMEEEPDFD